MVLVPVESTTSLLSSLLFLSFFLILYKLIIRSSGPKLKLPPSPPKLPIIRNIHQLGSLPHPSLRVLAGKYGPDLMLLQLGGNPTLVVSSAEAAQEMFKNRDIAFSNRPRTTAVKFLAYGGVNPSFSPYGEFWRQVRKICVLELLSVKRVQSFQFVREEEAADLIDKIRGTCLDGASSVNLTEMLVAASSNIVSRCVFGRKAEEGGGSRSNYGELTRKVLIQFTALSIGDMFRSLEWMNYLTGLIPQLKSTAKALDGLFEDVVAEHKNSGIHNVDHDQYGKKDFVDVLLQVQNGGDLDIPLTQDNIKAILLDMFVAGTDTSSATMEWLMAELVRNPDIMKKAQGEVRTIVWEENEGRNR